MNVYVVGQESDDDLSEAWEIFWNYCFTTREAAEAACQESLVELEGNMLLPLHFEPHSARIGCWVAESAECGRTYTIQETVLEGGE